MKPALIRLHTAVFLWGFTGVLGRLISLNEGWLVWWRLCFTTITLWLLFLMTGKIQKIKIKDFIKIGAIGSLLALHWLCFYGSIKYANVSIALTCLATSGLFSAILEPVIMRQRIKPFELFLGLMALMGITIIYFTNLHFSMGIYIGLFSSIFTVIVSVLNKRIVSNYKPETFTLCQLTGGFLGMTVFLPIYHYLFPTEHIFPVKLDWLWLLILSWGCTILTFLLYVSALKKVSAFTMNLSLTLEPVYGILLAFIIFHENAFLSPYFYVGFLLILIAVFLQMKKLVKGNKELKVVE
ncbi:MAG: EamA family transporter [Bacteroidetes bacterium]|nr:EamA family transporter [Bacteroidota bacterium]